MGQGGSVWRSRVATGSLGFCWKASVPSVNKHCCLLCTRCLCWGLGIPHWRDRYQPCPCRTYILVMEVFLTWGLKQVETLLLNQLEFWVCLKTHSGRRKGSPDYQNPQTWRQIHSEGDWLWSLRGETGRCIFLWSKLLPPALAYTWQLSVGTWMLIPGCGTYLSVNKMKNSGVYYCLSLLHTLDLTSFQ